MLELTELLGIELPIVQAPMAGAQGGAMAIAVSNAGGLGSLPCAMLTADGLRMELESIKAPSDASCKISDKPPTFEATTGVPQAIDSSTTFGHPSRSDGSSMTSAAL